MTCISVSGQCFLSQNLEKGHIFCLLNRAKTICSTDYLLEKEVAYLKNLYRNGCPIPFFNKIRRKTGNKSGKEFINLFIIPYLGKTSKEFGFQIQSLIKKRLDTKNTIGYKTTKVQKYFSLKSQTPRILNSKVVYKFSCSRDVNITYVGTSARHWSIRAGENLNVSKSGKSDKMQPMQNSAE